MKKLSTSDKIGIIGLVVAVLAVTASIIIPEIRDAVGLEVPKDKQEVLPKTDSLPQKEMADRELPASKAPRNDRKPIPATSAGQGSPYRGIILDSIQQPMAGVRVICPSCETQQTVTNTEGAFFLRKYYPDNDGLRQVSVSLSKGTKTTTLQLDWREPGTIIF
jgi:hypothetical protein